MQIVENIHKELMVCDLPDDIGLHTGTSGIALFLSYYDRIITTKKEVSQRVWDILKHNINQINAGYNRHSICNGISGFGWLCEYLRKLEMLNKEDIAFLDYLDPFLYKQMKRDIQVGNYDFLYGALGVGAYFLSRFHKGEVSEYLEELFSELEKTGESCENGAIKWISVLIPETGEKGYNISLSHGMSSIAVFFYSTLPIEF